MILLQKFGVVSLLVDLMRMRKQHIVHIEVEKEAGDEKLKAKVFSDLKDRLLPSAVYEQIDFVKRELNVGGGFVLRFEIEKGDQLNWILRDTTTDFEVKIFPADGKERLRTAAQECYERRAQWMRELVTPPQAPGEDTPVWKDSYAESETNDAPPSGNGPEEGSA